MSDNWLRVLPDNPKFLPPNDASVERAQKVLRAAVSGCDELTVDTTDAPTFFDPGANWSGVVCPACGSDLEEDWGQAMERAHQTGDLSLTTSCCETRTSLNDLRYGWPCGFARFAISALNPQRDVSRDAQREIEEALGTSIRIVRQHL